MCTEQPEDLTKIFSEQLREFLDFLQFYIICYKEKSSEVEWAVVGLEKNLMAAYADVPVGPATIVAGIYTTQEPFHIHDWSSDAELPARLKQGIAAHGLTLVRWFLSPGAPHRRLGALGMSGSPGTVYSNDNISFLRLASPYVVFEKCGKD